MNDECSANIESKMDIIRKRYATGNTIFVNTRKLDLPLKDRVENLFHEPMHLLGYSHKGNRVNAYNLQTVPYKAAAIFVKYLESIGKI